MTDDSDCDSARTPSRCWLDASRSPCLRGAPSLAAASRRRRAHRSRTLPQPTSDDDRRIATPSSTSCRRAAIRLPIAAGLACVLALRPRRRGTPHRQAPVIQTQIILAIVGAVVMLVVGASLARAFGIVGAAGLVRYRAKIDDPKDAGVMLSTLAVGLAAGVGLWMLAMFAHGVHPRVLWIVESFEPKATQPFMLKMKAKDPAAIKPRVEQLLARNRLEFELRTRVEGRDLATKCECRSSRRPTGCRTSS